MSEKAKNDNEQINLSVVVFFSPHGKHRYLNKFIHLKKQKQNTNDILKQQWNNILTCMFQSYWCFIIYVILSQSLEYIDVKLVDANALILILCLKLS